MQQHVNILGRKKETKKSKQLFLVAILPHVRQTHTQKGNVLTSAPEGRTRRQRSQRRKGGGQHSRLSPIRRRAGETGAHLEKVEALRFAEVVGSNDSILSDQSDRTQLTHVFCGLRRPAARTNQSG